jgi:hypothetical protein
VFKFADVNLAPPTEATVHFETFNRLKGTHTVLLKWTVRELKLYIEEWFGIKPNICQLFYVDPDLECGPELLRRDTITLINLRVKDDDKFIVDSKKTSTW